MPHPIESGSILIEGGTLLPESLQSQSALNSTEWKAVRNLDRLELANRIHLAGWTFFYMAGELKETVFGFNEGKRLRKALSRIIVAVQKEKCNCLEITNVKVGSFLKLPYVTLSAHSRHIQKGMTFLTA